MSGCQFRFSNPASKLYETESISEKSGIAPTYAAQFADARNVFGDDITRSPGPIFATRIARWSAAVALLTATAYFASTRSENLLSNSSTTGPHVRKSDCRTADTAAISAASTV